jgi:hypothetical protein
MYTMTHSGVKNRFQGFSLGCPSWLSDTGWVRIVGTGSSITTRVGGTGFASLWGWLVGVPDFAAILTGHLWPPKQVCGKNDGYQQKSEAHW